MEKIIFMNGSPNKSGNTFRIGEEILKGKSHEVLQMSDYKVCQYGQVYPDDQMNEILKKSLYSSFWLVVIIYLVLKY